MVALAIQDGKVRVGAQIVPEVHPAALLFAPGDEAALNKLVSSIRREGQRKAISVTPDGMLLEGRGRWKACQRLGITPITRVERGDPWLFTITQNRPYLDTLAYNHRVMIVGKVPQWGQPGKGRSARTYDDPPTLTELSEVSGLTRHAIARGKTILADGIPELRELVIEDRVPLYTAVRVSELSTGEQLRYVERVRGGESAKMAAPVETRIGAYRTSRSLDPDGPYRAPIRGKFRYVRQPGIRQLIDTLHSVKMVVEAAEGLDPSITAEQAGALAKELAAQHIAYKHVMDLLKARKEEKS